MTPGGQGVKARTLAGLQAPEGGRQGETEQLLPEGPEYQAKNTCLHPEEDGEAWKGFLKIISM